MKDSGKSSPRRKQIEGFFDDIETFMKEHSATKKHGSRRVNTSLRRKSKAGLPAVVTTNKTVARGSD